MNPSDPTTPTAAEYSPGEIRIGIKVAPNTMPNQISEEPAPCNRSTHFESRSGAMRRIIMKTFRMVIFFAILAPISFALVGLGCLVAYKGTIYFNLPAEIEKILGNAPAKPIQQAATSMPSPAQGVPQNGTYVYQEHAPTPEVRNHGLAAPVQATANHQQLRVEYYARAGMTAQDVHNAVLDWNASENNRLLEQVQLGYYLALNCTHFQNGTVNEATARQYLEKTLAKYQHILRGPVYHEDTPAPQVVYAERQSGRIPPGLSDYERALFKTRQQHTDVDLYSEHETRRQQEMAQAQRQQLAQMAAEQAALRQEIEKARKEAESRRADLEWEIQEMQDRERRRPMAPGETIRTW